VSYSDQTKESKRQAPTDVVALGINRLTKHAIPSSPQVLPLHQNSPFNNYINSQHNLIVYQQHLCLSKISTLQPQPHQLLIQRPVLGTTLHPYRKTPAQETQEHSSLCQSKISRPSVSLCPFSSNSLCDTFDYSRTKYIRRLRFRR
jgi:hypothetical protein